MSSTRHILFVLLCASSMTTRGIAQISPEEHAKHHPQPDNVQTGSPIGIGPGAMQGMEEMMRGMSSPPRKELYPSLMELPELLPQQKEELQRAAHERMQSGNVLMGEGFDSLLRAAPTNDLAGMQAAIAQVREGLARFDSGLSAHRALAEGSDARQIALQWFKSQMNLVAPPMTTERVGPLGLSWSHMIVMALLVAFAAVMIGMYFYKMKRAADLLQRLTGPPDSALAPEPSTSVRLAAGRNSTTSEATAPVTLPPKFDRELAAPPRESATAPWGGSLRIACIFDETPTVKTFRLMNPSGGGIPFTFLPGQFLTLAVALAGKTVKRAYTIASSPTQHDYVEITVKREELGVVSRYLHDHVRQGDLLQISAPQGYFTFTGKESDSIVLIGAGVGITPLMSIIRYLTDRGWPNDIYLVFVCRTTYQYIFRDELQHLQRRHANLHVVATMTQDEGRTEGTVWMGPRGRITKELISGAVPDLTRRRVHICGPQPMMDAVRAILLDLSVPGERIKTEAFGPAEKRETREPAVQTAMVEAPAATTATVTFTISGKAAPLPPDTTVLEAAEHVGVSIDNSCRAGTCGACKVKLLEGAVTMAIEDSLLPEEKARGIILACQAKSKRNLRVEA